MANDRNEKARREFEAAQQRKRFQKDFPGMIASGQIAPLDRFGVPIRPGDLVTWRGPVTHDLIWEVRDVVPVLEPNVPAGVCRVTLICTSPVAVRAHQPEISMIRVGRTQTAADAEAETPQGAEAAETPDTPHDPQPTGTEEPDGEAGQETPDGSDPNPRVTLD